MKVIRVSDYEELSLRSADLIASLIILKPDCVLGLATGGTPLGTYRDLIRLYREGRIDFSQVSSVNLDEYRGLKPDDPHSYRYFMDQNLFHNINIDPAHTFVPDGCESDPASACSKYDAIIDRFPLIDLQLLGLGNDGHIGFNEPSDRFIRRTHCVTLKDETICANSRFFSDKAEVPHQAYTMGIADIMKASRIHGDRRYYEGIPYPDDRQRFVQSRHSQAGAGRACDSGCSGLRPASSQELYRDRR